MTNTRPTDTHGLFINLNVDVCDLACPREFDLGEFSCAPGDGGRQGKLVKG